MAESPKLVANRYLVQNEIHAGGMTTVYRAFDVQTESSVALKRFDRDKHLPAIEREAFSREVDALRNLSHRNIVRMLDSGEDDTGKFFVVLELQKHDLLRERDVPGPAFAGWDDFAEIIALPLLDALAYAHELGIAHRDVKPANVLIAGDGTVKLADFGISKLKRSLQPRITLHEFMSPPFSPPEPDVTGNTYARDVYSVGVLCLWAISRRRIGGHDDIEGALADFDAPPEVRNIIAKAVSPNPSERQQSAAMLAFDLRQVQTKRSQRWLQESRPRCAAGLTTSAIKAAEVELATESRSEINKFISEDINTDAVINRYIKNPGTRLQCIVPYHYWILGASFRYLIANSDTGYNNFTVINITRPEPHFLQRDRESCAPCPVTFQLEARAGVITQNEACALIEHRIEKFDADRRDEIIRNRETALFDTWLQVLDAKLQYEQDQCKPVAFIGRVVKGSLVTLTTNSDLKGVQIGQSRIVYTDKGRFIRGEVWEVLDRKIILNCPGANLVDMPQTGEAKLDQYALKVSVDRQRDAINRIRIGTSFDSSLKDLILDPIKSLPPTREWALDPKIREMLDKSKCNAVTAALTTPGILLVEGPPGTGKTEFIVGLIAEELRRDPEVKVLLTSQTHIAIENALERLAKHNPKLSMVRILREQSPVVTNSSASYLISHQIKLWRDDVIKKSAAGLTEWAKRNGLDPKEVRTGAIIRQIAVTNKRIENLRKCIEEEDNQRKSFAPRGLLQDQFEYDFEMERVMSKLQELRDLLDADKAKIKQLYEDIRKYQDKAEDFLALSATEQEEWAEVLLGGTSEHQKAEHLIKLQSEWADRFGTTRSFWKPLIERSSTVASTCIGLASIEETSDIEFDLCIIDECSKATAMECCVPMARAKRWILIGDSKQLPPFQEEILARPELREQYELEAAEATESIFERMRRFLPDSNKLLLSTQYRMVEPIGRMISECFYDGKVESHRKKVDSVLVALKGYAVNWISTSRLVDRGEQKADTSFVNPCEAASIQDLLLEIDDIIHNADSSRVYTVLVLSGYDAQVRHLDQRVMQNRKNLRHLKLECCTIDRVQGREADIVLFSVTRSNSENNPGFLRSLERINVALSRAKELLIIVGDSDFVARARNAETMQRVLRHIGEWQSECYLGYLTPHHDME